MPAETLAPLSIATPWGEASLRALRCLLPDGRIGWFMRRTDDCLRRSMAIDAFRRARSVLLNEIRGGPDMFRPGSSGKSEDEAAALGTRRALGLTTRRLEAWPGSTEVGSRAGHVPQQKWAWEESSLFPTRREPEDGVGTHGASPRLA